MLTKHKIWIGAGVVAAAVGMIAGRTTDGLRPVPSMAAGEFGEGGEGGASRAVESGEGGEGGANAGQAASGDFPNGSFADALNQVLDGEGGQGGLGINPLREGIDGWSFTVPALTGTQLTHAVSGNSLRSERHFAIYFATGGTYQGWSLSWAEAPVNQCPSLIGSNYRFMDGQCWLATDNKLAGNWTVDDNRLCLSPGPERVTNGQECVHTALVLNSILFFGSDGQLIGKGSELVRGQDVGRDRK